MNILFLTLLKIDTLENRSIYHDLMREFVKNGHQVYIVSPIERRENKNTSLKVEGNAFFLNVKTLNIQKTNLIEKGLATITIEKIYLKAIKKYFSEVKFDMVLYSTPPITFSSIIQYVKKKHKAKSYLLLKDIFPQNAVDMNMMSKNSYLFKYFRKKEKKLYQLSDTIGCMSLANKKHIIIYNSGLDPDKIEVNPNTISPLPYTEIAENDKKNLHEKYQIPLDRKIFIYGGNLGKPQGIDFLIDTLDCCLQDNRVFFLIVGNGTEYDKLKNWFDSNHPSNAKLISFLPKNEYDDLMKICDVGLIFLHKNFTIPNYPSRLLSYLEQKLPVLVAADPYTDIGVDVESNKCGKFINSGNLVEMKQVIDYFCHINDQEFQIMRNNARTLLEKEFLVEKSYQKIIEKINTTQF